MRRNFNGGKRWTLSSRSVHSIPLPAALVAHYTPLLSLCSCANHPAGVQAADFFNMENQSSNANGCLIKVCFHSARGGRWFMSYCRLRNSERSICQRKTRRSGHRRYRFTRRSARTLQAIICSNIGSPSSLKQGRCLTAVLVQRNISLRRGFVG